MGLILVPCLQGPGLALWADFPRMRSPRLRRCPHGAHATPVSTGATTESLHENQELQWVSSAGLFSWRARGTCYLSTWKSGQGVAVWQGWWDIEIDGGAEIPICTWKRSFMIWAESKEEPEKGGLWARCLHLYCYPRSANVTWQSRTGVQWHYKWIFQAKTLNSQNSSCSNELAWPLCPRFSPNCFYLYLPCH